MKRRGARSSRSRLGAAVRVVVEYFSARRALVPFVGSVLYLIGGPPGTHRGGPTTGLLTSAALGLAYASASPAFPGNGLRDDGARRVGLAAYGTWFLALVVASLAHGRPDDWNGLVGTLAALAAAVVAVRAFARIRGGRGVSESLPRPSATVRGFTEALMIGAGAYAVFGTARALGFLLEPDPLDVHGRGARALSLATTILLVSGSAWDTLRTKRLVLDAGDRALTAFGVLVVAGVAAVAALVLRSGEPDEVLSASLAVGAAAATYGATEGDAERLARLGRRGIALALFGGPVVLLGALAAEGPGQGPGPVLVTGAVALLLGSAIAYLELPLRRADGHLLDAVARAHGALLRGDPETSVRDALVALRSLGGLSNQSPELWSRSPPQVTTVDAAGYPHVHDAEVPPLLVDIAAEEPGATVRAELLDALVVRRPDLRSLGRWLGDRGALSATLILRESEVEGVIVLSRGGRAAPLSLEEVRAIKRLADAFAGAAAARAAQGRGLAREQEARERADRAEARLAARGREYRMLGLRDGIVAERLAARAGGPYAPSARVAVDAIERAVHARAHLSIAVPGGADVVPYVARAHLASNRRASPLVVVDGASPSEREPARWCNPAASPLALAGDGLLFIAHADRLPRPVQQTLAAALRQKRAPWDETETVELTLVVTVEAAASAPDALDPSLASLLPDRPVPWPPLSDRGEDLRSLVLAGLAREGVARTGAPLGIEDGAFVRLADYAFPGDEAELAVLLQRLASAARGSVVRAVDVESLDLTPTAEPLSDVRAAGD